MGALFASGIGFFLFTLASRFTDVREMYTVFVQVWFYLTPVVYHISIVPVRYRVPIWLNPMYYLVQTFRKPIYDGELPPLDVFLPSLAVAVGCFLAGWLYFCRRRNSFALMG
jgi:homopolymeric O-antigen transport system permease protein